MGAGQGVSGRSLDLAAASPDTAHALCASVQQYGRVPAHSSFGRPGHGKLAGRATGEEAIYCGPREKGRHPAIGSIAHRPQMDNRQKDRDWPSLLLMFPYAVTRAQHLVLKWIEQIISAIQRRKR